MRKTYLYAALLLGTQMSHGAESNESRQENNGGGVLGLLESVADMTKSLLDLGKDSKSNENPIGSIRDFMCLDVTPEIGDPNTILKWSDRRKVLEISGFYDARYKAYSAVADSGLRSREFIATKEMMDPSLPESEQQKVLKSDPTRLSILGSIYQRTKFSRQFKDATVWFSVTDSFMPPSASNISWIATAHFRMNQNMFYETTPGKEVSKSWFVFQCKYLSDDQIKKVVETERLEDEIQKERNMILAKPLEEYDND